ncbi:MAG: acetate uptake transporter [Acidimicrobiales bacterium]
MSIQPNETSVTTLPPVADPGPLGLAAFALTTFLVSAFNAHWTRGTTAFLPFALGYGGLVQLLAGMWEFKRNNIFAATAFGTYGGFWIGVFFYFELVAPHATTAAMLDNDLGWIFLAFAIFNTYMLLWSTQVNVAVFGVFLTLEVTEIFLFIGNFSSNSSTVKIGGVIGIVTAVVAWYASAAGVINGMRGVPVLPVGKPFGMKPAARAD